VGVCAELRWQLDLCSSLPFALTLSFVSLPLQDQELGGAELWPSLAATGQPQTLPTAAKAGTAPGSSKGGGSSSGGGGGVTRSRLSPNAAAWTPPALAGQQQQHVQQAQQVQQVAPMRPPAGSSSSSSSSGGGGGAAGKGDSKALSYGSVMQSLKAASCAEQLRAFGFTAAAARAAADASGGDVEAATQLLVEGLLAAEVAAAQ